MIDAADAVNVTDGGSGLEEIADPEHWSVLCSLISTKITKYKSDEDSPRVPHHSAGLCRSVLVFELFSADGHCQCDGLYRLSLTGRWWWRNWSLLTWTGPGEEADLNRIRDGLTVWGGPRRAAAFRGVSSSCCTAVVWRFD